jgi:signal recognition particle subunit SRP54
MATKDDFTLDDFRKQFEQLTKMRPMKELLSNMPGLGEMIPDGEEPETAFKRIQGIIDAMTEDERRNPEIIDSNRLHRIAIGSGTEPHEIKQFLGQFAQVRTLMRQMAQMSIWQRIKMVTGLGKLRWDDKE